MPAWLTDLLTIAPQVAAFIASIYQEIEAGGGTPTPAQKAALDKHLALYGSMQAVAEHHGASLPDVPQPS